MLQQCSSLWDVWDSAQIELELSDIVLDLSTHAIFARFATPPELMQQVHAPTAPLTLSFLCRDSSSCLETSAVQLPAR